MTAATIIALYLGGGFGLLAFLARINVYDSREAFWLALLWPGSILLLLLAFIVAKLDDRGWHIDLCAGRRRRADLSPWGWRSRGADGIGWALRCPWCELQVWKAVRA